jgi:DNA-binding PadR family transcriptional regulator
VQLTKPTAYRLLNQMAKDGWILFREEQEGKRPPRRVYSITPQGEEEFQNTLRLCLANYQPPEHHSTVCLAYLDRIPEGEAAQLLGQRRKMIEESLAGLSSGDMHHGSYQLVIDNQIYHLKAELEWLDEMLDRMYKTADK